LTPPRRLVVHIDGGARGNPGPAAIGIVVDDREGERIETVAETIGEATNNVAEYTALLRALARARELGASEVEVVNDSELVARQISGEYRVKHPAMKPLHERAMAEIAHFQAFSIRTVPRADNADADALVNAALDGDA
jgi:ribonuclease HI